MFKSARVTMRNQVRCVGAQSAMSLRGGGSSTWNASPVLVGAIAAAGAVAAASFYANDGKMAHMSMGPFADTSDLSAIEAKITQLELMTGVTGRKTNAAFVFVKPHAVTPAAIALVKEKLAAAGITIKSTGSLSAETIDKEMLIDTHYGAIASKAVKLSPSELNVQPKAKDAFKKAFGMTWESALSQGLVYNAKDACTKLNIDSVALDAKWSTLNKGVNLIKFGGGFYAGQVDGIFVINGFYMQMRSAFTTPPASITYFTVEWPADTLSWEDFRGKVLGATDPKTAAEGSARRAILDQWQSLGLASEPNTGDNGVHASASPFEALAERMNWLGASPQSDIYGAAMLQAGIPVKTLTEWTADPQVPFEGRNQSLFDLLEDMDAKDCLDKAVKIVQS